MNYMTMSSGENLNHSPTHNLTGVFEKDRYGRELFAPTSATTERDTLHSGCIDRFQPHSLNFLVVLSGWPFTRIGYAISGYRATPVRHSRIQRISKTEKGIYYFTIAGWAILKDSIRRPEIIGAASLFAAIFLIYRHE